LDRFESGTFGNIQETRELVVLAHILDQNRITKEKSAPASATITGFYAMEAVKEFRTKPALGSYFEVADSPVDKLDIASGL
jgi:hypothetical protein